MACDPQQTSFCYSEWGPWRWVGHSLYATLLFYFVCALLLLGLLLMLRAAIGYFRQPFCYYCGQENVRTRVNPKDVDTKGRPECDYHYKKNLLLWKGARECDIHGEPFQKRRIKGGFVIDVCPSGCVLLDAQQMDEIRSYTQNRGSFQSSRLLASIIEAASSAATEGSPYQYH